MGMEDQRAVLSRISVYATDTNPVLTRILQLFGKSRFEVTYMQVLKTEDENLKRIIIEASFPKAMTDLILARMEKIIEVQHAFAHPDDDADPTRV